MVVSGGRVRAGWLVVVAALVATAAACGGGSGGATTDGELDPAEWVGAELTDVPEGHIVSVVEENSSFGRRVGYGTSEEGLGDNWRILVSARTSYYGYTMADILRMAEENGVDAAAEVNGLPAAVGPMTDEGRVYGFQVVWEQAPGLMVEVQDSRYDDTSTPIATRESVLELAATVRGMDRAAWDAAEAEYDAAFPYAGPPEGAVEREVADGALDGRQWTLSVLEDPSETAIIQHCFRLGYAGEDTGPGCATQRVVLGGKGFVIGPLGPRTTAPELTAGHGSSFDPIEPRVIAFGADPESHVSFAVLPDGACGVDVGPDATVGSSGISLDLLPGDPGVLECAGG